MGEYYIIYEEKYLAPGVTIADKVGTKLLKLYTTNKTGTKNYNLVVKDNKIDEVDQEYRDIVFPITVGSEIYKPVENLYKKIKSNKFSTENKKEYGLSYFQIETNESGYLIVIRRDFWNMEPSNDTRINFGDYSTCGYWKELNNFYIELFNLAVMEKKKNYKRNAMNKVLKITLD